MNVLVIEDQRLMADFLRRGLSAEGHAVTAAAEGSLGLNLGLNGNFDIILLDVALPDISGFEVCERLRDAGIATPILMLTAMDTVPDRIKGLRHGADDYLIKPYSFDELLARIDALVRRKTRMRNAVARDGLLSHGDIALDLAMRRATRAGVALPLTRKELGVLEVLLERAGMVVSRESLLSSVWGVTADPLTNIVEVYVARLRRKLEAQGPPAIETVRGFGYRLI